MSSRLGRRTSSPSRSSDALERPAGQPVQRPTGSAVVSSTSPVGAGPRRELAGSSAAPTPGGSRKRILAGRRSRSPSSSGVPSATILPADDDRHAVGEPLGLVHVVGGQEDGLAEVAQARRSPPRPGAAPRGRSRSSARRGRAARGRRSGRRRRRGGAAGRRRACRRGRRRARSSPTSAIISSTPRGERVVAGVQLERLAHGQLGRASGTAGARSRSARARRASGEAGSTPSTRTSPPVASR